MSVVFIINALEKILSLIQCINSEHSDVKKT